MSLDWNQLKKGNWTKFLYPEQPRAATMEEWAEFDKHQRKTPVKYFLAETFPDFVRSTFIWPVQRKRDKITDYLFRQPVVKIKSLNAGWHDVSEKILHVNFQLLVDFVEVECAWMEIWCNDHIKRPNILQRRLGLWRSAELGTLNLAKDTALNDPTLPEEERNEKQAQTAKIILDLYHWWKARANRPDPYEVSGWTAYCATRPMLEMWRTKTDEEREITKEMHNIMHRLEEQYEAEDTAMLVKLVNIRKELWT